MCGIAGFSKSKELSSDQISRIIDQMTDTLSSRGPDDRGIAVQEDPPLALGHRRLSVIDLSSEGRQPMLSACGRYRLVYNGEIYNYKELRLQLQEKGCRFRGSSDTEVMLYSFAEWGLHEALQKFNGMFAFALHDLQEQLLHLGRDRIGIKPLFYGWTGNKTFLFCKKGYILYFSCCTGIKHIHYPAVAGIFIRLNNNRLVFEDTGQTAQHSL